jgi:hypothetical protein
LDRSNLSFQRVSAIAPPPERSLRVQDLSRGATPTRRTQPKSLSPPTCPQQTHPIPHSAKALCLTPQKNGAAAGQGQNEHWIVATNPPKRVSAIAPPPERSLRVQDLSRGATPTRRTQPRSLSPPTCPQQTPPTSRHPSSSGTGPERALDRSNKSPKARQRDSPTSRAIPASAGPVPRTHPTSRT